MSGIHVQNGKLLATSLGDLRGCCCSGPDPCRPDDCGDFLFEITDAHYGECADHWTHRHMSITGQTNGSVLKPNAQPGDCYNIVNIDPGGISFDWGENEDPTAYAPTGDYRYYWDGDSACQQSLSLSRRNAYYYSGGKYDGSLFRWHSCSTGAKGDIAPGVQPADTGRLVGVVTVTGGSACTAATQPTYGVTWGARCSAGRGMTIRVGGNAYTVTAAAPLADQRIFVVPAYGRVASFQFWIYLR